MQSTAKTSDDHTVCSRELFLDSLSELPDPAGELWSTLSGDLAILVTAVKILQCHAQPLRANVNTFALREYVSFFSAELQSAQRCLDGTHFAAELQNVMG